jgi:hypothetical protein
MGYQGVRCAQFVANPRDIGFTSLQGVWVRVHEIVSKHEVMGMFDGRTDRL